MKYGIFLFLVTRWTVYDTIPGSRRESEKRGSFGVFLMSIQCEVEAEDASASTTSSCAEEHYRGVTVAISSQIGKDSVFCYHSF